MKTLHLHSWKKLASHYNKALGARPLEGHDLKKQIGLATNLHGVAIARVVRRLEAGYPISLPLREEFNADAFVQLLTSAGARITLSPPADSVGLTAV